MVPLILGLPSGMEWVILLIVVLILFGGSRLAGVGKGAGRAIREFKEETQDLKKGKSGEQTPAVAAAPEQEQPRPATSAAPQQTPGEATTTTPRD